MHHPRNWIHPSESQILRGRIQNDYDILLHGHAHDQWVDEVPSPQHVVIAAGAGTAGTSEEFGYNIVELYPHEARVLLRTYDQRGSGWIAQNIARRAEDGCWAVKLHRSLTPSTPTANSPDIGGSADELVETPNSRGRYGLDSTLLKLTKQLRQQSIIVVYGLAGVGKSVAVDELKRLPTWRGLQAISLTARTDSGPNDLFSELAPFLGNHEERPEAPSAREPQAMAAELIARSPEVNPFFLHVQRAHLWLENGRWRNPALIALLDALTRAYPGSKVVLEARERLAVEAPPSHEIVGLSKQALTDYLANPPGLPAGWKVSAENRKYIFHRLGGGHGGGAHSYGVYLLAHLATAKGVLPDRILRQHPDDYAQVLFDKLFRDLYQNVLDHTERELLFACSLYRDGIHFSHLGRLAEALSLQTTGESLIRRGLLIEASDWLNLHDLASEQARRLEKDSAHTRNLHRKIAALWLADLRGQRAVIEANVRRAMAALFHLEQGGQAERIHELAPCLFGRRSEEAAAMLWRMERDAYEGGNLQNAADLLEFLLAIVPTEHRALRFLGEILKKIKGGFDSKILELFRRATRIRSDFPQYWADYGAAVASIGTIEETKQFLEDMSTAPDEAKTIWVIAVHARVLENAGRGDEAAALRTALINTKSRHPAIYSDQAKWLLDVKENPEAALKIISVPREMGFEDDFTVAFEAFVLDLLDRPTEAASLRSDLINRGTSNPAVYVDQARQSLKLRRDSKGAVQLLLLAERFFGDKEDIRSARDWAGRIDRNED